VEEISPPAAPVRKTPCFCPSTLIATYPTKEIEAMITAISQVL